MENSSIDKTLYQLSILSKVPIHFNQFHFEPPSQGLRLSSLFWREWGCNLGCSGCCRDFTLDYLPEDWARAVALYPRLEEVGEEVQVEINGVTSPLFRIFQKKPLILHQTRFCQFVNPVDGGCQIHEENPLSCQIELIKFKKISDTGHIIKQKFGRGWAMMKISGSRSALCEIEDPEGWRITTLSPGAEAQIQNSDLPTLRKMLRWADHWGIPTYLPELIQTIEDKFQREDYTETWIWRPKAHGLTVIVSPGVSSSSPLSSL